MRLANSMAIVWKTNINKKQLGLNLIHHERKPQFSNGSNSINATFLNSIG